MEIRDPLHGTIRLSPQELRVIESQEFQRLRAIKQLGFAEFSFPGATHNRFLHSIGVCHLAGMAFDTIFQKLRLPASKKQEGFRQLIRLAALLHDIGHGPLSHTTEDMMPFLEDLKVPVYKYRAHPYGQLPLNSDQENKKKRATHEDYTIKYITDSPLTEVINQCYQDFTPYHVALVIDRSLQEQDDFFIDHGINFRPLLTQLISSELDVDRLDYLERDSFFCGTNYGKVDTHWLISHMTAHLEQGRMFLAINRRALYTFDDFLLARHHMHLMVYFHHKSIIYEEMLNRFLMSEDCTFRLPADINEYTKYNDYKLFEVIANSNNPWARRIAEKKLFKVLIELHSTEPSNRPLKIKELIESENIPVIWASSQTRLSKYHSTIPGESSPPIFVVDVYNPWDKPYKIDEATEIFQKYEGTRIIDRIYVQPEHLEFALQLLSRCKF
ncbi:MAG: HD domain-containing protein [Bdellovibrionaceae bacterium]|nr:HD domain-containing protein [Pseudobdellovibrionaceae bacterium]MDW8190870.1 HD domain-containing protein [Pseudobdellovibrionaceae bacterium]